jgi:hypothetical protein
VPDGLARHVLPRGNSRRRRGRVPAARRLTEAVMRTRRHTPALLAMLLCAATVAGCGASAHPATRTVAPAVRLSTTRSRAPTRPRTSARSAATSNLGGPCIQEPVAGGAELYHAAALAYCTAHFRNLNTQLELPSQTAAECHQGWPSAFPMRQAGASADVGTPSSPPASPTTAASSPGSSHACVLLPDGSSLCGPAGQQWCAQNAASLARSGLYAYLAASCAKLTASAPSPRGSGTAQQQIRTVVTTFLSALAGGDGAIACAQLTGATQQRVAAAFPKLGRAAGCAAGVGTDNSGMSSATQQRLVAAQVIDVRIDGDNATVQVAGGRRPEYLTLTRAGWRITFDAGSP